MHHPIVGTSGMEPENHMAVQDANYGASDHWVHDNYSYQPTTMAADYGSFYAPNIAPMPSSHPPITDGLMSSEAIRMPPLPAPAHSSPMHHTPPTQQPPQLPMLITNNHLWPSQITNPVSGGSYSAPAMSMPPVLSAPPPPPPPMKPAKPTGRIGSQPRRTLTDEERRNMCLYREENPTVKQSEIGAKFNVERSTVSKVLRWKDKYLYPEDRSTSPIKRSKGKFPDIERALSNWVRNQRKSGKDITDEEIKKKAQYFAATVGNDNPMRTASANWLEKFKQKNNIGPGRLTRRASEANIPDSARLASASVSTSSPTVATQPSGGVTSPTAGGTGAQASPPSAGPTEDDKDSTMNGMFDFGVSGGGVGDDSAGGHHHHHHHHSDAMNTGGTETNMDISSGGGFKQMNNISTTSLQTSFTDTATSGPASSTYSALSPSTPFTFSPDPNSVSAFPDPNFQRPRSQTFPNLDLQFEPAGPGGNDHGAPKYGTPSTAPPSAMEGPMDGTQSFANIDSALGAPPTTAPPHVLHRTASSGSLRGRAATPGSTPGSPTQEDARKAVETLIGFIQTFSSGGRSPVDEVDMTNLMRLTEKLGIPTIPQQQQPQQIAPGLLSSRSSTGLGGLSRIPETEVEMGGIKSESMAG
ncbi:hypothetical protein MKZ38_000558 [Zalerion maritima]|uniref:HTH CENPB-type domain-containing protein n=1 Tax=Zalerion maritima TaxID=339359 RepID=A0AAD5RFI6_9PEZI|nr:hypothetical protein MKZ38_000558 [Zalerion maritima]